MMSIDELVALVEIHGGMADRLSPPEELLAYLGGVKVQPYRSPLIERAKEIEAFVKKNRYVLNLRCRGTCLDCPAGTVVWCSAQLRKGETHGAKEDDEGNAAGDPTQGG